MVPISQVIHCYSSNDPCSRSSLSLGQLLESNKKRVVESQTLGLKGEAGMVWVDKRKGTSVVSYTADLELYKKSEQKMRGLLSTAPDTNYVRYGLELNLLAYMLEQEGQKIYALQLVHLWDDNKLHGYSYRPKLVKELLHDFNLTYRAGIEAQIAAGSPAGGSVHPPQRDLLEKLEAVDGLPAHQEQSSPALRERNPRLLAMVQADLFA
jgi:hypothetical protein